MSCKTQETLVPKIECPHTITIEQGETEDRLRLYIVSELDEVWVTVGDYPRKKIGRNYYACISFHIPRKRVSITIEAEQICEYIY